MKLKQLLEYWEVIPNYPNSTVRKHKKNRISILKHPEDRERLIKWSTNKFIPKFTP
jgi:hypothetical protein